MMRTIKIIILLSLTVFSFACEDPYANVSSDDVYDGKPIVMLNSEAATIRLSVHSGNNSDKAGVFVDSLTLSHTLNYDIKVTLEFVMTASYGELGKNFIFNKEVVIKAGQYYGNYQVEAISIPLEDIVLYKLAVQIKEVDSDDVIAGLYGIQIENEERQKQIKVYSFQN